MYFKIPQKAKTHILKIKRFFKKGDKKIEAVIISALGVGGATVIGAVFGLVFMRTVEGRKSVALGFSAGVMIASSVIGLILPAIEYSAFAHRVYLLPMLFIGALFISLADAFLKKRKKRRKYSENDNNILLFVLAIAIHNLPEGISAGVGFGSADIKDAIFITIGIALQNIPEGLIIISPMLSLGYTKRRTFFYAALTGLIEVIGTFIGYFAISFSNAILPYALSLAGGIMLYVTVSEALPDALAKRRERSGVAYAFLVGFAVMLLLSIVM